MPYACSGTAESEEILLEANPYAAISHSSALVIHGLTDQLPKIITATKPNKRPSDLLPLDTTAEDWLAIPAAPTRLLQRIHGHPV